MSAIISSSSSQEYDYAGSSSSSSSHEMNAVEEIVVQVREQPREQPAQTGEIRGRKVCCKPSHCDTCTISMIAAMAICFTTSAACLTAYIITGKTWLCIPSIVTFYLGMKSTVGYVMSKD